MEITREQTEAGIVLKLTGRLDASWSDFVSNAIAETMREGLHRIAIDMSQVSYLSSAGIRVLMQTYKQLRAIAGTLHIVNPSAPVRSTLELSGLSMLLAPPPRPPEAAAEEQPAAAPHHHAAVSVELVGKPQEMLNRRILAADCRGLTIQANTLAVGLGALGDLPDCLERFGEFLAVGGAACFVPADGSKATDYLVTQREFLPTAQLAHGIIGSGTLNEQFRFGEEGGAPLSSVLRNALAHSGAPHAAVVILAETAWLVGAALKSSPDTGHSASALTYPAIKDVMSFTAEPLQDSAVSLITGFISTERDAFPDHMRPLVPERTLFGHLHAAVFSYAPIKKGVLDLESSVRGLFENQTPRGVLHLLNDWRECVGNGESRLIRGACWYAPCTLHRHASGDSRENMV